MIPLKGVVVLVAAVTMIMPVVSQVTSNCSSWLTSSGSGCVRNINCGERGDAIYIWEDCPVGEKLFTITDPKISLQTDCPFASGDRDIILKNKLDAEDTDNKECDINGRNILYFTALNINEFPPYPDSGTAPTSEVTVEENKIIDEAALIYYSDEDFGETKSLSCEQLSSDFEEFFSLKPVDDMKIPELKAFRLSVKKELDFESRVFYKLEYNIISTDEKNTKKSSKQTFFVTVADMPDNPPFWSVIRPVYPLEECKKEDELFTVTAQDRDVEVNYDIKYNLVQDPGGDYFKIDETTGLVRRIAPIDREELIQNGISSFSLAITATEYKNDSTEGEEPNSSTQITVITILDCNDQVPTFNNATYEITMDELTEDSKDQDLDLLIVVKDMDEGINGSFTLTTSDPKRLFITPKGKQSTDVVLTAHWEDGGNNYFNYEVQEDIPLNFTIFATEDGDTENVGKATVVITLRDVNDNIPVFNSSSYTTDVAENTSEGSDLLTVKALDGDISEKFGAHSISYSLQSSCHQFEINNQSGLVTLGTKLDFENGDKEILCKVYAKDMYGAGLIGESEIIINVVDVVDETPWIEESTIPMDVDENSAEGVVVGSFIVKDADEGANIIFSIESSVCSGVSSTTHDVSEWFSVSVGEPNHPEYPALVKVQSAPDREKCSEVTLIIMAVDTETVENQDNVNGIVVIAINDVKDEAPQFKGDYSGLAIDEFNEIDPPKGSVDVFVVTVSDPDISDVINLAISKGADLVELSESVVSVEAGEEKQVHVRTKKDKTIDRETLDTVEVEITLTNEKDRPETKQTFSIKVNDLNDKKPMMEDDLCNREPILVWEDDGTGDVNGTVVFQIRATDDDMDDPYNVITYIMKNDQISDSKNPLVPFMVDEVTGNVSVLLTSEKTLDREQYDEWELLFTAYDHCRQPIDTKCTVLSSSPDCKVKIIVKDVNDHDPEDLQCSPDEDITVNDFLRKDDELGYLLWAHDKDEGENATLTYKVLGTYRPHSDEDMGLFRAQDEATPEIVSCRLYATQNFEGKNLTGPYTVILQAKDGGNRSTNFNVTVTVIDGNDQVPYFVFDGCPYEEQPTTIKMQENAYLPGQNGRPNPMEVKCSGPDGTPFNIKYLDADTESVNKAAEVWIDAANSSVENATNETEQLAYWSLEPRGCSTGCKLYVSHQIDREKGSAYNLALRIRNTADPPQESMSTVRIVVTNEREFAPYFCLEGNCTETVIMYENDANVATYFMEATDLDNTNTNPGDDEYENVYYYIVGGDRNYFRTIGDTQRKIILKPEILPNGLDRETKSSYSLEILTSNDDAGGGRWMLHNAPMNNILHFNIIVGDVNDEKPIFPLDVIFTSFMESSKNEDTLTTIKANDADLNETLTYTMLDDLQWFDIDYPPDRSFVITRKDNLSAYLKLDIDPTGMTQGYCSFTVRVEDAAGHSNEAQVKVYIINEDYQVSMYFANKAEDVKKKQSEIEEAYTLSYEFACVIDSITATQTPTGETEANVTTVYMHFIDAEKNEPVDDKKILDLSDNADLMMNLKRRLDNIDIYLVSVDSYLPSVNEKSPEDRILTLKILLVVVSLVLGCLLVLLLTVYCLRTRSLTRKVKVLSTNTFGSKDSGLNHMGHEMGPIPGSNLAHQNPVFSENGAFEVKHHDTGSISSGDSVLVGVEDNPEFKSYSGKGGGQSSSRGYENPSLSRTIDEVSAPPPGVHGGTKGNPLLNLGGLQNTPDPSASSQQQYAFSEDYEEDTGSLDGKMNSNFSFS